MAEWNVVIGVAGAGKTSHAMSLLEQKLNEGLRWDQIGFLSFSRAACSEAIRRAAKITGESEDRLQNEGWYRTVHSAAAKALQIRSGDVIDPETKTGKEFFNEHFGVTPNTESGTFGERLKSTLDRWSLDRQRVWPVWNYPDSLDCLSLLKDSHPRTRFAPDSHPIRRGGAPMREAEKHCKSCTFRRQKSAFLYVYRENLFSEQSTLTPQFGCEGASVDLNPIYNKGLGIAPGAGEGANRVRGCERCGAPMDQGDYGAAIDTVIRYERQKDLFRKYDFTDMVSKFAGVDFSTGQARIDHAAGDAPTDVKAWLVDEAQDCSNLLWLAIERLTATADERYLLGDPYQAVYGFIGAEPMELLARQETARSGGTLDVLARSWRNPPEVVNWGEEILSEDPLYHSRQPFSETESGTVALLDWQHFQRRAEDLAGRSVMILGRTWYSLEKPIKLLNTLGIPWTSVSEKHNSKWDCPQKVAYVLTMRDLAEGKPISEQDWRRVTEQLPAKFRSEPVFKRGTKAKWNRTACSHRLDVTPEQLTDMGAEPMFFRILQEGLWKTDMFLLLDSAIERFGIQNTRKPSIKIGTAHSVKGMEADIVYCMSLSTQASAESNPHEERCLRYVAVTRTRKHFRLIVDPEDVIRGKPVFWPAPVKFGQYDYDQVYLNERISDSIEDTPAPEDPWDLDCEIPRRRENENRSPGHHLLLSGAVPGTGSEATRQDTNENSDSPAASDQEEWWDF